MATHQKVEGLTEVVAQRMALDVDLDWELIKEEWRDEYRRRAASVVDAAREFKAQRDGRLPLAGED